MGIKPIVAIVGRPNVGKSTLFNRLVGRRISIVEDTPGVTRDRIYADVRWLDHAFTLIDTGGLELFSEDSLYTHMRQQAQLAAESADVILFLLDGQQGLTAEDYDVADYLRRCKKPLVLGVNKVDNSRMDEQVKYDYYCLGLGEPHTISAVQGLGLGDMLDELVSYFPQGEEPEAVDGEAIQIAVVGKPNAGKSSLVNAILREDRVIVSNIPGTTRDAIDTPFEQGGRRYNLIDTAGMRKKGKIELDTLERYSVIRSLAAVRRADVCLMMIDGDQGVTEQDAKIAGFIDAEGKPAVVLVNKWDLVEKDDKTTERFTQRIYETLSFMTYAPVLFVSCKTGQRLNRVLPLVEEVYAKSRFRTTTGVLNDVINDAVAAMSPPSDKGRPVKIYYATQAKEVPPTFVLFMNYPDGMHYSYRRYLENHLRKTFDLKGTPIRLILRGRDEEDPA
jgi:GTP-binding protein